MSGHSRWAQVKHKKAITDAKKGKLFSKMVREITIAAKTGGDPDANPRLRAAIERGRAIGLPRENIERAIAKAAGGGDGADLQEFLLEATAPEGVQILIEGITDNTNRTFAEIRHIVNEHDSRIADPGSLLWNFEKIGTLELIKKDAAAKNGEEIEMALIDAGARDFQTIEDAWTAETDFADRDKVRKILEGKGMVVREASHDFKAKNTVALGEKASASLDALLDALAEHDDVGEVYTNLEMRSGR